MTRLWFSAHSVLSCDRRWWRVFLLMFCCITLLTGCSLPQVSAEERLFLPLSVEFLDEYVLPSQEFEGTRVGGLSAIAYERQSDRFFVLSDDRSNFAPARFYTLAMQIDTTNPEAAQIADVTLEQTTALQNPEGEPYASGSVDPEALVLSPRQSIFVASEGDTSQGIPPFIDEFDRTTGEWLNALPIPRRYIPGEQDGEPLGVQNNLSFESLAINPGGFTTQSGYVEPFRLFAATESSLAQDASTDATVGEPIRLLHYLVGEDLPSLLAEHLYPLEPTPDGVISNGLTELLVLDQAGHFLSLERTFGVMGAGAKLFQLAIADATDTSGIPRFGGDLRTIQPIRKQLLLDLRELGITLDNLEAMTLGPRLPDGSQSLILLSDDNFSENQKTQFLLFRLTGL
ncbi:esterase-like activity of phytase family protein [Vacuolonema iberomarrocanum]|uniref:esterase-like activity of phytase family protein n=1 Tax=Vacuolonema iberomarrocanum TaxID=3454632 RepID=UPI003F6DFBEE